MRKMTITANSSGWIMAESLAAMAVIAMLGGGLAISQHSARTFNAVQMARHRCLAAAAAQLDSLSTTSEAIEPEEIQRLWPGVAVTVEQSPGTGQWQQLRLIKVTAHAAVASRTVAVDMARYVPSKADK